MRNGVPIRIIQNAQPSTPRAKGESRREDLLARFQAKLVLGQAAANVKIRGRILFAVRGCETILFST